MITITIIITSALYFLSLTRRLKNNDTSDYNIQPYNVINYNKQRARKP